MKKNLFALLLLVGVVFSSCTKDTPAVTDPRDKFVGTWNGSANYYYLGTLDGTTVLSYTITKDASSSNKIFINDAGVGLVNCPATVNGNSYTISNFAISGGGYSYIINGTGTINGNFIVENGTEQETDLTTGDVFNYTYTTNLSK